MVTVGITGGIGSGKSTVCKTWASMGAYVLNADDLAKELMVSHTEIRKELIKTFGDATFNKDGSLNRTYLAEEAFQKRRVQELNDIIHPRMPDAVQQRMHEAAEEGIEVGVYEAALLLESGHHHLLDYLVLVLADEERRLQWVQERDEANRRDVKSRIDAQRDFEKVTDQVDMVIRNDGTLEELKKKAADVFNNFLHS